MSDYIPVIVGDTGSLRKSVEGLLTDTPETINERLSVLDEDTQAADKWATFGMEVEYQLVSNPDAQQSSDLDKEELCKEIILRVQGHAPNDTWPKGAIIHPDHNPEPIYGTHQMHEFGSSDVAEIRTAPSGALEAVERYWTTIQAIGDVAAQHGFLGLIQSTHVNAAVFASDTEQPGFVRFADRPNHPIVAATQANLVALNSLQIDPGLETNITVLEAYPKKDASTAIYNRRIEFRHPTVGLVDPRIDMLAVLDGLSQTISDTVPASVQRRLHECHNVKIVSSEDNSLKFVLQSLTLWDKTTRSFVLPANLDYTAKYRLLTGDVDDLVRFLADDAHASGTANNARILRDAISGLGLRAGELTVDQDNPYAKKLGLFAQRIQKVNLTDDKVRIVPDAILDSPEIHATRRSHITRSSIVRRVLGNAAPSLTSAGESIEARQELVDGHMVVLR